jgi:hypothetical protein
MMILAVIVARMIVMGSRRVGIAGMRVIVMLDLIADRIARMCAEDRDQARDNGADQRQEDDCLNHGRASLRMTFSENRFTFFRIMP